VRPRSWTSSRNPMPFQTPISASLLRRRVDLHCITGWLRGVSFLFRALVLHLSTDLLQKSRGSARRVDGSETRQSPAPGFGEKYWSLSGFPSHSLESGGRAFLTVIFGQIFSYSGFSDTHFSSPDSQAGLIASTDTH